MAETDSRQRRSISCEGESGRKRVRRSCVIIPSPPPKSADSPRFGRFQVPDNLGFDGKFFFPNQTPNYNLSMFESSCLYWDEDNETWTGEGCKVTKLSMFFSVAAVFSLNILCELLTGLFYNFQVVLGTDRGQILCKCNHLTSFGSDLLVAPNPIDFDSVFNNFDSLADNVAVLVLISTILGLYIIGCIFARRADKKDVLMVRQSVRIIA